MIPGTLRYSSLRSALALAALLLGAGFGPPAAAQSSDWRPYSEFLGKYDWVQMTSGEWVKGEIIAMYKHEMEFDSDEFGDLSLDWADIRQIRSVQIMNVGLSGRRNAVGILMVRGDEITVVGEDGEKQVFDKSEVISITAGAPKEINFWRMKVFFGLILRTGNSEVTETNLQTDFRRRTIRNRLIFDSIVNTNRTDGEDISESWRASATWDRFINDRFFFTPVSAEWFSDRFQNISRRVTLGFGVGYQLLDSPDVEWEVSGGPAYQEITYDTVTAGQDESEETIAMSLGTSASWDITGWLEFDGSYSAQFVNEASGSYNHHLVLSLETDITKLIDLDVSWIWDRVQDPVADADQVVPEQDDFRTTVGLTFDF